MKKVFNYLKYSGVWIGLIVNPFHWRLAWDKETKEWPDNRMFENCVYVGPI
jgi:hypothetical protein